MNDQPDRLVMDLFVEDRAHEEFLKPLLARIPQEERMTVWARVRSATGGHGRAMAFIDDFRAKLRQWVTR